MPKILIRYYETEEDFVLDAPKRRYECDSIEDALSAVGQIERHETMPVTEPPDF